MDCFLQRPNCQCSVTERQTKRCYCKGYNAVAYNVTFEDVDGSGDNISFYAYYSGDNNRRDKPLEYLKYTTVGGKFITYDVSAKKIQREEGRPIMRYPASDELCGKDLTSVIQALNIYFLVQGHSKGFGKFSPTS